MFSWRFRNKTKEKEEKPVAKEEKPLLTLTMPEGGLEVHILNVEELASEIAKHLKNGSDTSRPTENSEERNREPNENRG